jgi:hypothetical protein
MPIVWRTKSLRELKRDAYLATGAKSGPGNSAAAAVLRDGKPFEKKFSYIAGALDEL